MACFGNGGELSKECFETVLQTMAEGVIIVDRSGIIRFCNRGVEAMSGLSTEAIVGKRCQEIMACSCGSMLECGLLKAGAMSNVECELRRVDGTRLPVLKNGRALLDNEGVPVGGIETLTDISALKRTERKVAVLEEQVTHQSGKFHLLVGKSQSIQQVFEMIDLAAASNASVLITGETGTGKELAARSIHERSSRSGGPLVKVNCSALPESLLESELFGHARGAFTGAIKDKIGRFELADNGTLFLDEIGDISPFIQVKLLRFLQEKEFERVGESTTRKSDVRIIAATNRNLRELISTGEFREDLYYRLKVFPLHLPPLRERKEDIGLLIGHFIKKFNEQTGKEIGGLTHDAALTLMDYCWPGNIRELENAIEHAFVTCREKEIGIFDLPVEIRRVELRAATCAAGEQTSARDSWRPAQKRSLSREELLSALAFHRGNRAETARRLGIDRTTLWRQMKRLGIKE
jgi:PAS domain S-box-containing protein